jgi:hypothetical protein
MRFKIELKTMIICGRGTILWNIGYQKTIALDMHYQLIVLVYLHTQDVKVQIHDGNS